MHPAALSEDELLKHCEWQFQRRSGPGGQHRNKVETAAIIRHRPTGVLAEANEKRSQAENRAAALFRLRLALAVEHRTCQAGRQDRDATVFAPVSELWRSRTKGGRLRVAREHADFPAILAELLDALEASKQQLSSAAEHFSTTTSQLIRLLKQHPAALRMVNGAREKSGYHRLK